MMETRRWLLPFTWGMDTQAVDAAVRLAESGGATLVAVSLIVRSDRPGNAGVRLEHIQQSKDFLEAVRWKTARLNVSLDQYEVFTVDTLQSITTLAHELDCDAIVLVSRGGRETLLSAPLLKRLLEKPPAALIVLRLPSGSASQSSESLGIGARILAWLRKISGEQVQSGAALKPLEPEGPIWIRTEEHHLG
jgi:nucleotide-binding universal stress UspA family protein